MNVAGLLPAIRRVQATSGLEKTPLTALPNTCLIVISGLGGSQFTCNLLLVPEAF